MLKNNIGLWSLDWLIFIYKDHKFIGILILIKPIKSTDKMLEQSVRLDVNTTW